MPECGLFQYSDREGQVLIEDTPAAAPDFYQRDSVRPSRNTLVPRIERFVPYYCTSV
jgi:hypothetical protein